MKGTVLDPDGSVSNQHVLLATAEDIQGILEVLKADQNVNHAAAAYMDSMDKKISLVVQYIEILEHKIAVLEAGLRA